MADLVDCGECATQGCLAGKCRNAVKRDTTTQQEYEYPCMECGMVCKSGEFHPFAACLMFKACHNGGMVRDSLKFVAENHPATLPQRDEPVAEGKAEIRDLLAGLVQIWNKKSGGRAGSPNHGHAIPGIWDSDNGELAGKPCAECALYDKAREYVSDTAQPSPSLREVQADAAIALAAQYSEVTVGRYTQLPASYEFSASQLAAFIAALARLEGGE